MVRGTGILPVILCLIWCLSTTHRASGADNAPIFRRTIDFVWDAERATGDEVGFVRFYTAGHHQPNGTDVRVTTEDGRQVASRVLTVGPGDEARVLFSLAKNMRKYHVFFGATTQPPKALDETAVVKVGLLLEMYPSAGGSVDDFKQVEALWERSSKQPLIGRTMIAQPHHGFNPFSEQQQTISRVSGTLFVPADGQWQFAASADDRGALYLDGQPVVFAAGLVGDIRFNAKLDLKRGPHPFLFYHVNGGGDGRFTVAWKGPGMQAWQTIGRESFGICPQGNAGPMEQLGKSLTADFKAQYLAECFYADHYAHRVRLTANQPKATASFTCEWDFGDGQTSAEQSVEHVFLDAGVYPVRLTMKIGNNADTQTIQLPVSRDYEHYQRLDQPPTDDPPVQSRIVSTYKTASIPTGHLARAVMLHARALQSENKGAVDEQTALRSMIEVAARLAGQTTLPDPDAALRALREATTEAFKRARGPEMLAAWDRIPPDSNLRPRAARFHGQYLLWWAGDFAQAVKVLAPHAAQERDDAGEAAENDPGPRDAARIRRLYGQALVLSGKPDEGAKVLKTLTPQTHAERQVVMSGALARSIEHYIDEKEWESGDSFWERWQTRYPADFLEGYSALLKVRLIELRGASEVAAKVAESFASALPESSYSPQLLDRASKLMASIDPGKSRALRDLLKKNYPEDPLAQ
ncbi:MAG: PKD domain-containing protein [Tepidisphaeraceae bacterium]